jgi:methionine-rich copper-binding protein CopC
MLKRMYLRLTVAACALLVAVPMAFAHAVPVTMTPAKDSTVSAPTEVSIVFSEELEPKFSSLELLDPTGMVVSKTPSVADPKNAKHLTLALPTLAAGVYTLHWVSTASDGHKAQGKYSFTVK